MDAAVSAAEAETADLEGALAVAAVVAATTGGRSSFGSRGGFDPSSFLSRLDANGNGVLDPSEQQGPAQFLIGRMAQSDPSIKAGQPIPLKKITDGFQKMREQRESGGSSTPQPGWDLIGGRGRLEHPIC